MTWGGDGICNVWVDPGWPVLSALGLGMILSAC